MIHIVVSIGSNSCDRAIMMDRALEWLGSFMHNVKRSEVYETPEHSGRFASYFNCVVEGDADIELGDAVSLMKGYEMSCGRTPESKLTGVVPIDLDIVVCDGLVLRPVELTRQYFLKGYRMIGGEV